MTIGRVFKCSDINMDLTDYDDGSSLLVVIRIDASGVKIIDRMLGMRQHVYQYMASYYR